MSTCTFFGVSISSEKILSKLRSSIYMLISQKDVDLFYVTANNSFDQSVIKILDDMLKLFPHITYRIVLAKNKSIKKKYAALSVRNRLLILQDINGRLPFSGRKTDKWLVEHSEHIIFCLTGSLDRVSRAGRLSVKRGKQTLNVSDAFQKICSKPQYFITK